MDKYKLKTNDTLKCAACGNKEFTEMHIDVSSKLQGAATPTGTNADTTRNTTMNPGSVTTATYGDTVASGTAAGVNAAGMPGVSATGASHNAASMSMRDCWVYHCTDCGHIMAFTERATVKEGIL